MLDALQLHRIPAFKFAALTTSRFLLRQLLAPEGAASSDRTGFVGVHRDDIRLDPDLSALQTR